MIHDLSCRTGLRFPERAEEARFFAGYGRRHLGFVRLMLFVGGALFVLFVEWDRVIDPIGARQTMWVRVGLILPAIWAAALLLGRRIGLRHPEPIMAAAAMISTACVAAICAMLRGGIDVAAGGINLIVLFVCTLLPMRLPWYVLFAVETLVAYGIAQAWSDGYRPGMPIINGLMLGTALFLGGVSVAWRERSARQQFVTARDLDHARDRVEELLLSMLPREVLARIRGGATLIADHIEEVSILFADIVGFTDLSRRLPATELIQLLNRLFSEFDRVAAIHGMQKIKTIGDAYMAVGGLLPSPDGSPAMAAAAFAGDLRRITANISVDMGVYVSIRIGLHVGPVVAGVIGTSRPAFDCWGEAVNLASRLESAARTGDILLSAPAHAALRDAYVMHPQPPMSLKGIGLTHVWRLGSRHPGPAAA